MNRQSTYYLDPERGDDERGFGTHRQPFRTLEGAVRRIETAFPHHRCHVRHDSSLVAILPRGSCVRLEGLVEYAYRQYQHVREARTLCS